MPFFPRIVSFTRNLFHKSERDADLDEEIRSQLELLTDQKIKEGLPPDEARRAAKIELGGVEQLKEQVRAVRTGAWLDSLLQDIRFALRMLRKNPGFTAVAVLTLALGIAATTSIFSVVYGVLLQPLPYPHSDRIVVPFEVNYRGGPMHFADPNFDDLRTLNHSLVAVAEYGTVIQSVSGGTESVRAGVASVSADFFRAIGVQPALGRGFDPADRHLGAAPVALVSYGYWRQNLGASTDLSSFKLTIDNRLYSVVGVMPAGFRYPTQAEIWYPRELDPINPSRTSHSWGVIGRLRDGVSLTEARADVEAVGKRIAHQFPGGNFATHGMGLTSLKDSIIGQVRTGLLTLLCAVGFLLLVACANVANLLLSQATARQRELAIRAALGAGRKRLVRQFLTESLLVCATATGLGVLLAFAGVRALPLLAPKNLPRLTDVSINVPVLLFTLAVSIAVALGLGVFTAVRATKTDPNSALVESGRGYTGSRRGRFTGNVIAAMQLAIALVLLIGAGLLGRSLLRVLSVNPGFRVDSILAMDLAMPTPPGNDAASKGRQERESFDEQLLSRLRTIPGVTEVGAASDIPLDHGLANGEFLELSPSQAPKTLADLLKLMTKASASGEADYCAATEGYFRALGIPLIRGRMFDERDREGSQPVALVSESLARITWPNQNPIGHTLEFGNMDGDPRLLTVIGVVGDTRSSSLEAPVHRIIYVDMLQRPEDQFTVVMHTDADAAPVLAASRSILRSLSPETPPRFREFSQVYSDALGSRPFNLAIVGVFAIIAFFLATAGTYSVVAYSFARRTHEIGIRIALGAQRKDVFGLVLRHGMKMALAGVAVGVAGALAVTRLLQTLLFGIKASDPLTIASAAVLVAFVALLACYIPARRVMRVDPVAALRRE
ncbi:MAG TPA: ABC transporter permease [Candidatus Acidoferrales bacterium]|nr:ABC transporter permease [Candidatus Acidoferrales bacterium]